MVALEERRKQLKMSQDKVAKKVGISRQYYNSIENNKRKPSVVLAKKLAQALEIDWTIFY